MRRTSAPAPHHVSSSHQQRRQDISSSDSDFELAVEPMMPSRSLPSFRTSVSLNIGATPPSPRLPTDGLQGPSGSSRQGLPSATPPSALPPSNPASAPNALIPVKVKYLDTGLTRYPCLYLLFSLFRLVQPMQSPLAHRQIQELSIICQAPHFLLLLVPHQVLLATLIQAGN